MKSNLKIILRFAIGSVIGLAAALFVGLVLVRKIL